MTDTRWSYDPRTNELDVWDSENGRIGHYERHGYEGYRYCAQGRLTDLYGNNPKKLLGIAASIYGDRPFDHDEESEKRAEEIREQGKAALEVHFEPYPVHWQLTF